MAFLRIKLVRRLVCGGVFLPGLFGHALTLHTFSMLVKCSNTVYSNGMKTYPLRYLYAHLGEALKELPFAITKTNKIVAIVIAPHLGIQEDTTILGKRSTPEKK